MSYPDGSPQLAVEVVSPSNRPARICRKVEVYLKNGGLAVWVVYPEKQKVLLATAEDETEYRRDEHVPLPSELVPDPVSFPVREFFEEADLKRSG
jgi:Uma2 family endonuclease